jgi:hypothetical protein
MNLFLSLLGLKKQERFKLKRGTNLVVTIKAKCLKTAQTTAKSLPAVD